MRRRRVEPVEVQSPLASSEAAAETGLVAGVVAGGCTPQGVLGATTIRHWRRVLAATRRAETSAPAETPKARAAGRLPKGARRR